MPDFALFMHPIYRHHPLYAGASNACAVILRTEGVGALYKGLIPTLVGIAPYAALNFASYDLLKKYVYHGERPQSAAANLAIGGAAGTVAGVKMA